MRRALVLFFTFTLACSSLPRDQEGTWNRIQHDRRIRVGLVENPPWVIRTTGEPAGTEVELVKRLASSYSVTPEWFWGGEQTHMEALHRYQLDLVIGGIDATTPWAKTQQVGISKPYFIERVVVGLPPSSPQIQTLQGKTVTARDGDAVVETLVKKGARVERVRDISHPNGLVAAPNWQLPVWSYSESGIELDKRKHVIAVAPGENGWLKRIEDFLHAHEGEVQGMLQQQESGK